MDIDEERQDQTDNREKFFKQIEWINQFMKYAFSLPMTIIERVVENIHSLATQYAITCSMCLG